MENKVVITGTDLRRIAELLDLLSQGYPFSLRDKEDARRLTGLLTGQT